ncbi:MAG: ethanolamine utilization protein EutN [Elusimicrobia bacterium GWA2_69_24]|nr:MAG: ethanolamine utilization protein EutN [Elusimicrobia bacterium GWA2_69_24]HBL16560.1 ethanolamine utilization protein EutN [Elusimicrobiota bacterium]
MIFARVIGNIVSTNKDERLVGKKLLMVQPVDLAGAAKGNPIVAVDAVGAGESEFVLLVQGSSARQTEATDGKPVDCTIVAIIDYVERGGKLVFEKSKDKGFPEKG